MAAREEITLTRKEELALRICMLLTGSGVLLGLFEGDYKLASLSAGGTIILYGVSLNPWMKSFEVMREQTDPWPFDHGEVMIIGLSLVAASILIF